MSTRSRTRSATTSSKKTTPPDPGQPERKSTNRSRKSDVAEKENAKGKAPKPPAPQKKSLRSSGPVYCSCQKGDDGSPMILCDECKLWYHFSCVDLKAHEAEEIQAYICPACNKTSGRRTAMDWEGPEAVEEVGVIEPTPGPLPKKQKRAKSPVEDVPSESEEDPSSDEYVGDSPKVKGKRPIRRVSYTSDSETDAADNPKQPQRRRIQKQSTPPTSSGLKRKPQTSETPPPKRQKPDVASATDDPARKYCLNKFEEVFREVYLRYPHVRVENQIVDDPDKPPAQNLVPKSLEELTEDEKSALPDASKQFAMELEQAVFEIYSEPDKHNHPYAGPKYKDRFRTLWFNLKQPDRAVLHQRIVSSLITAKEISIMSSTDLANEETKQSIKAAEQEALEHSILTPTVVPRAKITHKGLEDIEDIHGQTPSVRDDERTRREEEEQRERERMARLRAQTRQRTASTSLPPESPIVPQQASAWGAPPAVPPHAILTGESVTTPTSPIFAGAAPPILSPVSLDVQMQEPELNLSDFINIDDDIPTVSQNPAKSESLPPVTEATSTSSDESKGASSDIQTGISPFASKEDVAQSSFNLDALWNNPKPEGDAPATESSQQPPPSSSPIEAKPDEEKEVAMDSTTTIADDNDFDMFLEDKPDPAITCAEAEQAALDALPHVWKGKINMPLDSSIPQETPVIARQIGGRSIGHDSVLWKTLFPSDFLRIDGRVPVENSSKFLLQMRMNSTKELVAVAFSPAPETNDAGFGILSDFLIAKGRHGLVFPWGNRPKEHHPGKELYIIPLLSSDPLPDYMELLDNLHLPKLRKANLLVGIWILNRGKLTPPPLPPPPPPAPPVPAFPPLQTLQYLMSAVPKQPATSSIAPPSTVPPDFVTQIASWSQDQIQQMIQDIRMGGTLPFPFPASQQQQPPPPPPHQPVLIPPPQPPVTYPPIGAPQQWSNAAPGYGPMYPPISNAIPAPNLGPLPRHEQPHLPSGYDRHDYREPRYREDRNNEDRGGRSWRGRGRGRPGGGDNSRKPVDSGWPSRSRPDNSAQGPSSPTRRW